MTKTDSLEPEDPVPLYFQLFRELRNAIAQEVYAAGDLLPSENELEKQYNVSRITVRRAIEELRLRNYVARERGRGTRVMSRKAISPSLSGNVDGMIENNLSMAMETHVQVMDFDYLPCPASVAQRLGLPVGSTVQHSIRIRSYKGAPFSYLTTYVPESIGRRFNRNDLSVTPLLILLERTGIKIERAEQVITAENASPIVAQALMVDPNIALLRVCRTIFDTTNTAVEYIEALYQPNIYSVEMHLSRKSRDKGKGIHWTMGHSQ